MSFYQSIGLSPVINASGRMTNLGGSAITPEIAEMMVEAGQSYVDINALHAAVGKQIAEKIGFEDAMVTPGAGAGIAHMAAACVAGNDLTRVQALPDPMDSPNEVLLQAGHDVNFGAPVRQMIALGGGKARTIGTVNRVAPSHVRGAVTSNIAALLYVKSHHCVQKGMLSIQECAELCQESGIPLLVDAAAEEDLSWYSSSGAALVTFSGGKAIGGPSSGIVAGSEKWVERCRAQLLGIGRSMKVGKETMAGLLAAVTAYVERDVATEAARQKEINDELITQLSQNTNLNVVRLPDDAGRQIERVGLKLDPRVAQQLVDHLRKEVPPIHPRSHFVDTGLITLDPRPLTLRDARLIAQRVHEFFAS